MSILKCPVCAERLFLTERAYQCSNHHSFDLAKEGYLNLLLNAKKTAGDAKKMMQARQHFLNAGYYQPLSDHLNTLLDHVLKDGQVLLDMGCGEGYYLSRFSHLTKRSNLDCFGFDISKVGIKMAAKRQSDLHWLVANFAQVPFSDHSVHCVLSMFSEYHVSEIERILEKKGYIIIVRAGKQHLQELKHLIYPEIHEKVHAAEIKFFPNFSVERFPLTYSTSISSSQDLQNLLLMTPHYWKIKPESVQKLNKINELTVTVDVEIEVLTPQTI